MRRAPMFAFALLIWLVFTLAACSPAAPPTPPAEQVPPVTRGTPGGSTPLAPGLARRTDGSAVAVGTLQRDDDGSWLVIGALPDQAAQGHVLAVLQVPGTLVIELPHLEDDFVRVSGHVASIEATPAKLAVESIATITAR